MLRCYTAGWWYTKNMNRFLYFDGFRCLIGVDLSNSIWVQLSHGSWYPHIWSDGCWNGSTACILYLKRASKINSSFVHGIDSCNAWQWVGKWLEWCLDFENYPVTHWHVVNCCSKMSMAFISSNEIPKCLVSMSYHADRLPLGMKRLKTW